MRKNVRKAVLAYSGGLDTSVLVRILNLEYGYDVVCCHVDVGEARDALMAGLTPLVRAPSPAWGAEVVALLQAAGGSGASGSAPPVQAASSPPSLQSFLHALIQVFSLCCTFYLWHNDPHYLADILSILRR